MSFEESIKEYATRPGVELGGPEPQPGEAGPDPDGPWYGVEVRSGEAYQVAEAGEGDGQFIVSTVSVALEDAI